MAEPSELVGCPGCAERDRRIASLEARIAHLEKLLEQRTRDGKRQAGSFSKGPPKDRPAPPGRKAGEDYGTKAFRKLPDAEPDEVINVPLPKECPHCGGRSEETHVAQQFQVEIPRRAILRRFDLHIGECKTCGKRLQPRHAMQTSDALGVCASQIGPDAQSLVALMKNKFGLSYGDITQLMHDGFGIELTAGAAAHIVRRAGHRAEPVYQGLGVLVRRSDTVYPDETSWKVAGKLQWLWDFVTDCVTYYVIRPSRGVDVPAEVLGMNYAGRMTHDGWSVYDQFTGAIHQQCLQHILRRAIELIEQFRGRAAQFPLRVKAFVLSALALRDRREVRTISDHGLAIARNRLETRLDHLLASRPTAKLNRTFRHHLEKHRDELLTFLYEENLEATNWPAEQGIRPAVVNRKVFGGNRTPTGAHALEVLASIFATCRQNTIDALGLLSHLIRTTRRQPLLV